MNRRRKTRLRHYIRAFRRKLAEEDASGAQELLPQTFAIIDRAAKWGVIKANTAARFKSRLHRRLKQLATAQ